MDVLGFIHQTNYLLARSNEPVAERNILGTVGKNHRCCGLEEPLHDLRAMTEQPDLGATLREGPVEEGIRRIACRFSNYKLVRPPHPECTTASSVSQTD